MQARNMRLAKSAALCYDWENAGMGADRMELQQLIYFKVAAECENLSRAAEKLYISQPALSRVIQRLEADLGTELFERQGKSIRLNSYGKIALSHTNEILQSIENLRQAMEQKKAAPGTLRVVTNLPNIVRYIIPCCAREREDLKIEGTYVESISSAKTLLDSGAYDLVIFDREEQEEGFVCMPLFQDRLVIQVLEGHPLFARKQIGYDDLQGLDLVETTSSLKTRSVQITREILKRNHVAPHFIQALDNGMSTYLMKTGNYGVLISALTCRFWTLPKSRAIPLQAPDATIDYYCLYRADQAEVCRAFIKWLKNWGQWANQMFISESQ